MDEKFKLTLLYDFYGELLTTHQRSICEQSFFEDLSLSEIASAEGTSRQAVHDIIKRSTASLNDYESKLHLVERFLSIKSEVEKINKLAVESGDTDISQLAVHILEEL